MSAKIPAAPAKYDQSEQQQLRNELERRDDMNHKKDAHLRIRPGTYFTLTDAAGQEWSYTASTTDGSLVATPL